MKLRGLVTNSYIHVSVSSQLREFGNWGRGRTVSFLGIHKSDQHCRVAHCKDKIPKFRNKYSQKRNIGASVPFSTFMSL
jgi:hypothetical protein